MKQALERFKNIINPNRVKNFEDFTTRDIDRIDVHTCRWYLNWCKDRENNELPYDKDAKRMCETKIKAYGL